MCETIPVNGDRYFCLLIDSELCVHIFNVAAAVGFLDQVTSVRACRWLQGRLRERRIPVCTLIS